MSVIILLGLAVFIGLGALFFFAVCAKKIKPDCAGVRVGLGGIKVRTGWMLRIPFVHQYEIMDLSVKKLEIERKGIDGLICADNIRADIVVAFYIRINFPAIHYVTAEGHEVDPESAEGRAMLETSFEAPHNERFKEVERVAQSVGCERASDIEKLRELFEAKFAESVKTAGKLMEFRNLNTDRQAFRAAIIDVIGHDLDGFILTDVAIDYLEQTPLEQHDPANVLDAEGIRKITEETAKASEEANSRIREKEVEIKKQDVRAHMEILALERQYEEELAYQKKAVDEVLNNAFPDMETVEKIREHIWKDHPVWGRLNKLEEEVEQIKSQRPSES